MRGLCLWVTLALALAWSTGVASQDACAGVLSQGIYNTVQTSSSRSDYTTGHQAMCNYVETYTYEQYKADSENEKADGLNVQVDAGGAYSGMVAAVSFQTKTGVTKNYLSKEQFTTCKSNAASYKNTMCSSSGSTTASSADLANLKKFVSPEVTAAYSSCIELYKGGMVVKVTSGVDATTFAADLKFVPAQPKASSTINSITISPANSANCTLAGTGVYQLVTAATTKLDIKMATNAVYSLVCVNRAAPGSDPSTVWIATNLGTYKGVLYAAPAPSKLDVLTNKADQLVNKVDDLTKRLQAAESKLASAEAKLASAEAKLASTEAKLANTVSCGGGKCTVPSGYTLWVGDYFMGARSTYLGFYAKGAADDYDFMAAMGTDRVLYGGKAGLATWKGSWRFYEALGGDGRLHWATPQNPYVYIFRTNGDMYSDMYNPINSGYYLSHLKDVQATLDAVSKDAIRYGADINMCHYNGRGCITAGDAWDARTSSNPNGDWEKWRIGRR